MVQDRLPAAELVDLNPFLARPGRVNDAEDLIGRNRRSVLSAYGAPEYRRNLRQVYNCVKTVKVAHRLDNAPLVEHFMRPDHFSLLKWGSYAE